MTQIAPTDQLLQDVRGLIEDARSSVAVTVNVGLTMLYWQIGRRIQADILQNKQRTDYGRAIVATLSQCYSIWPPVVIARSLLIRLC
jgi:hypothetical protein